MKKGPDLSKFLYLAGVRDNWKPELDVPFEQFAEKSVGSKAIFIPHSYWHGLVLQQPDFVEHINVNNQHTCVGWYNGAEVYTDAFTGNLTDCKHQCIMFVRNYVPAPRPFIHSHYKR